MPVHNEAAHIEASISAVMRQTYPRERIEILVVDGRSTDGTAERARVTLAGRPASGVLDNPQMITPCALNIGIANARGRYIIRVDGHCEIASAYVERCIATLESNAVDCVGGSVKAVGYSLVARGIAAAQSSGFGIGNVAFRRGSSQAQLVDTVPFGAYRREVFDRVGPFDERLVRHQDYEFNARLRKAGGKILYNPEIRAIYHSRTNLKALWKQYLQYGIWKARVAIQNRQVMAGRHFVPPLFVAAVLGGAILGAVIRGFYSVWLAGFLSYSAACLGAAIVASVRSKELSSLASFPAFPVIHFAWGIGFWLGVLRRVPVASAGAFSRTVRP